MSTKKGSRSYLDALSGRLAPLAQLNTPANIPLSYRAYALYHVDDPAGVERDIHELIDMIGLGLACLSATI